MGFNLVRWSPYLVGIFIGILSWLSFWISDRPLGASTAYARTGGMIEKLFLGDKVLQEPYYKKFKPVIDWEWMLVLGIIIGSGVFARVYPFIQDNIFQTGKFNKLTFPEIFDIEPWKMVAISATILFFILIIIEIV